MGTLRSVQIPKLIHVAPSALDEAAQLLEAGGVDLSQVLVLTGRGASSQFGQRAAQSLQRARVRFELLAMTAGSAAAANDVAQHAAATGASLLMGVGGGRTIDTAKYAAARCGRDFLSVPTTLAHDGIASPVASLTQDTGERYSYGAVMPVGVLADLDVLRVSPRRTLRAGVADLVSNLTAVLDWHLAEQHGNDSVDGVAAALSESAAMSMLAMTAAMSASNEATRVLAQGLILSGLAMGAAGTSRPCSGAEHLVSHSLDNLLGSRAALHGEQVALGTLLAAQLHGRWLIELRQLFQSWGLPLHPRDLGISMEELVTAAVQAPSTRPSRFTVLTGRTSTELLRAAEAAYAD